MIGGQQGHAARADLVRRRTNLIVVIKGLKTQKEGAERAYEARLDAEGLCLPWTFFFVAVRWFCTLHLAVNFMFVPLVRNRFAHTLHRAAYAFVSYGIVLVQVQPNTSGHKGGVYIPRRGFRDAQVRHQHLVGG